MIQRKKAVWQAVWLTMAVTFLCVGALRGEIATVLSKAVKICLECVGIG